MSLWIKTNIFWHKHYHRRLETALVLGQSALVLGEVSRTVQLAIASSGGDYDFREYISVMIPFVRDMWSKQEEDEENALKDWVSQGPLEILPEAVVDYQRIVKEAESDGVKSISLGDAFRKKEIKP